MNGKFLKLGVVVLIAFLAMGSIRKKEDVLTVTEAQTSPISLQQKLEEEKDGKKGAPSPSMTFYGGGSNQFMVKAPVNKKTEPQAEAPEETGQGLWESQGGAGQESAKKAVDDEESWWSEEDEDSFSGTTPSKT